MLLLFYELEVDFVAAPPRHLVGFLKTRLGLYAEVKDYIAGRVKAVLKGTEDALLNVIEIFEILTNREIKMRDVRVLKLIDQVQGVSAFEHELFHEFIVSEQRGDYQAAESGKVNLHSRFLACGVVIR